jgi:hypothetical protein
MATALNRNSARQSPLEAYLDFGFANFVTGADAPAIQLPAGAVVTGGDLVVDTVWNGATDVISVGDPLSFNRYLSGITLAALGRTVLVPTGYIYLVPTLLSVRWVGTGGPPTTGAGRLRVSYIRRGKADTAEGLDQGSRLA